MSIHLRYELRCLLRKCGYGITREYRWPESPRKPLTSGIFSSSVQAPWADPVVQIGAFDGQRRITSSIHILQIDAEGMDYDALNWFFVADVQPAMINFENLHLGRPERSASRELLQTNGYWWIETSQNTFVIEEFLARP